jgi:hypothetical protein
MQLSLVGILVGILVQENDLKFSKCHCWSLQQHYYFAMLHRAVPFRPALLILCGPCSVTHLQGIDDGSPSRNTRSVSPTLPIRTRPIDAQAVPQIWHRPFGMALLLRRSDRENGRSRLRSRREIQGGERNHMTNRRIFRQVSQQVDHYLQVPAKGNQ